MAQIAVKLPDRLLAAVDDLVGAGAFANRSHAVRHALEVLVRDDRRRAVDEAFTRGFTAHPETAAEMAEARRLAIESINEEPWERWW